MDHFLNMSKYVENDAIRELINHSSNKSNIMQSKHEFWASNKSKYSNGMRILTSYVNILFVVNNFGLGKI